MRLHFQIMIMMIMISSFSARVALRFQRLGSSSFAAGDLVLLVCSCTPLLNLQLDFCMTVSCIGCLLLLLVLFIFERSFLLRREMLEARFWTLYHTFHVHFSAGPDKNSNVRPRFRTFGRNLERSAEISNIGGPCLDFLLHFSFFPEFPVAHVLWFDN